ncbi:MAG: preprotein translocase subunit SecG [Ignavibacteriales bacterium]|nr:MAG: preprotein translocase subunit SecG [Ignavibacteriales bacterium]
MYTLLVALSIIISILLIIIVLMQSSKGGGLAGTFGGAGGMGSMFGTRRTADFLSKATWWLGGTLAVLAIVINLFFLPGQSSQDQIESVIQKSGRQNVPTTPTLPQSTNTTP